MLSDNLPRIELANTPTQLKPLKNLGRKIQGPEIWIKRDDQTGLTIGGNKVRKLEYVLKQAIDQGCDSILTVGGIQSNHVRTTMAAARVIGLHPIAILGGKIPGRITGNYKLTHLLADEIIFSESSNLSLAEEKMICKAEELKEQGKKPFTIPLGASTPIGSMGYPRAFEEIDNQCKEDKIHFSHIFHASSSGGTQAGLIFGKKLLKREMIIDGILVSKDDYFSSPNKIQNLCNELSKHFPDNAIQISQDDIKLTSGFEGLGYAIPSSEGQEAIHLLARTEGIILDPVYTAKAFAALLHKIEQKEFSKEERILFIHTGGLPSLFAL